MLYLIFVVICSSYLAKCHMLHATLNNNIFVNEAPINQYSHKLKKFEKKIVTQCYVAGYFMLLTLTKLNLTIV